MTKEDCLELEELLENSNFKVEYLIEFSSGIIDNNVYNTWDEALLYKDKHEKKYNIKHHRILPVIVNKELDFNLAI